MKRRGSISFGRLALALSLGVMLIVAAALVLSSSARAQKPPKTLQYKVYECDACDANRVEVALNAHATDGWKFHQANGSHLIFEK